MFLILFPSTKIKWNLNINANYGKALCWLKIEISLVLFRTSLPWDAFHYWSFSGASVLHKLSQGLIYIWTKDLVKDVPIYVSSKTIMIFGSNDFNSANGLNFLACIQRQIWKKLRHVSFLKHFNRNMKYIVQIWNISRYNCLNRDFFQNND